MLSNSTRILFKNSLNIKKILRSFCSFSKDRYYECTLKNKNYVVKNKNYSTFLSQKIVRNISFDNQIDVTLGNQIVSLLEPKGQNLYLDMTFGDGHHTSKILDTFPEARVICLDRDIESFRLAVKLKREKYEGRILPLLGRIR